MNIKEKLKRLCSYYTTKARVGHTQAMLNGINKNSVVITNSFSDKNIIPQLKDKKVITIDSLDRLNSCDGPLSFDNHALHQIFNEAKKEIEYLEAKNARLVKILNTIQDILDYSER